MINRIFIDERSNDRYKISMVDKQRIFNAENPELLGTVYECSLSNPTRDDDAQIFYALASTIGADNIWIDLIKGHRSHKLNYWSISIRDNDNTNLFTSLRPLTFDDQIELYKVRESITISNIVASKSKSLFSLVAFSKNQKWKTGIMQECIDRLVKLENRANPNVYAIIDENYRKIMRFKFETETSGNNFTNYLHKILLSLNLTNSHDNTIIPEIPESIISKLKTLTDLITIDIPQGSVHEQLSAILFIWSGAIMNKVSLGYQITVNSNVLEGLSYMQEWLPIPDHLEILKAHM
jgi:hypothetical protein